jgi:predicted nucleic acid-binding protein
VLVVNASPLIHLAEAGLLDLLRAAAEEFWVPEPVAREILGYGDADPTASALASNPWLQNIPVSTAATAAIAWDLGPGDSSVLTSR